MRKPRLLLREANRVYHGRLSDREFTHEGVDVMAEDWDVLVILDAWRYDTFEKQHSLPGTLESRPSRGAHTSEFVTDRLRNLGYGE